MIDYQIISRKRNELMGIAMFWVILFHSDIRTGFCILDCVITSGYAGVDIFIFLSGFGLYYSLSKDCTLMQFYEKRVIRIIPAYIIALFVIFLSHREFHLRAIYQFIINAIALPIYIPDVEPMLWYIPAILSLYIIAPYIKKQIDNYSFHSIICLTVLATVPICICIFWNYTIIDNSYNNKLMLITSRIPIFIIGVLFGKQSYHNKKIQDISFLEILFIAIFGIFLLIFELKHNEHLWNSGLYFIPFVMIVPFFTILLSVILSKCNYINRPLSLLGSYSLEIYLFNELSIKVIRKVFSLININNNILFIISILILNVFSAYFLSKLSKSIVEFLKKKI